MLNLECLYVRKNEIMHENEIRDVKSNIGVYGVDFRN